MAYALFRIAGSFGKSAQFKRHCTANAEEVPNPSPNGEGMPVYCLRPSETTRLDDILYHRYKLGTTEDQRTATNAQSKVIMIIGQTGSGKSTLINGMVNYALGVDYYDPFRFMIVKDNDSPQTESQTNEINVYTIEHEDRFQVPCSLTLIDTPGYGDTRGYHMDERLTIQISKLFEYHHIQQIDCVGFVVATGHPRLTAQQRYIFKCLLSLFGVDIKENIVIMVTYADSTHPRDTLEAVRESEIPVNMFYKFNNSSLYANTQTAQSIKPYWELGIKSFENFFKSLMFLSPKSPNPSRQVIVARRDLADAIDDILACIRQGLVTTDIIEQQMKAIRDNADTIKSNGDFSMNLEGEISKKEPIAADQFITNCRLCNATCHEVCRIKDDNKKMYCWAMDDFTSCRICPRKCHWQLHQNDNFMWVHEKEIRHETYSDLGFLITTSSDRGGACLSPTFSHAGNFVATSSESGISQDIFETLETRKKRHQDYVRSKINEAREKINEIREKALLSKPLNETEYIDYLINNELSNHQGNWQKRVEQLNKIKDRMDTLSSLAPQ